MVVAVPPSAIPQVVAQSLAAGSLVTDVGSVKWPLVERIGRLVGPEALTHYVGSHPMAGSERSGPLAASAALFDGRPWAITPHLTSSDQAVDTIELLAAACGAATVRITPRDHDRAVALTSHLPHLMAVLVAGRLARRRPAPARALGPGRAGRDPDRRRRPGPVATDPDLQRAGTARGPALTSSWSSTS